jgi:hypothetical protein
MCAYNSVNGVPACGNGFLFDRLRFSWGFKGYVTSDSGAIENFYHDHHYVSTIDQAASVALRAGCDVCSGSVYTNTIISQAIASGHITQNTIDQALRNGLRMRFLLGLFDPIENQPYWHYTPDMVGTDASQALNKLAARQSIVLLKNKDKTLPFPKGKNIALIGPHCNADGGLLGNYLGQICPTGTGYSCMLSVSKAITQANVGGTVKAVKGCNVNDNITTGIADAVLAAQSADLVILTLGLDSSVEAEYVHDRVSLALPGVQEQLAEAVIKVGKPTAVVLLGGSALAVEWLEANAGAILDAFYPGFQGAGAIADVIFGDYNPGGKLPVTFYHADYVSQVDFLSMDFIKAPGRTYKYFTGTPLYPFGYGLSYTTFTLTRGTNFPNPVAVSTATPTTAVHVDVVVKNTGTTAGDEVVFLYFTPPKDLSATDPNRALLKQLFGFQRVHLAAGASATVGFDITSSALQLVDAVGNLVLQPGTFGLIVNNGGDQQFTGTAVVSGNRVVVEYY